MAERPVALVDPRSGRAHVVSPTALATGVLTVRGELARHVARAVEPAAARGAVGVLRAHLEQHTYVSGSWQQGATPGWSGGGRRRQRGGGRERAQRGGGGGG